MENLKEEKATSKSPMLEKEKAKNIEDKSKTKKQKKYNESRDPFYRRFFGRLNNKKERALVRQNLGNLMEEPSYRFRCCPWNLWTTGVILLLFDMLMTYVIYYTYERRPYYSFVVSINILFYILVFTLFYQGEIEYFTINRKKAFIKKSKVNIFGSKKDRVEYFNDVDYFQIVMKGVKKGAEDNRKYFIRVNLKDKMAKPIEWGYTWHFDSVSFKYQVCLAMVKGIVVEKVEEYLVKDEAFYPDYMH
jgi:hypothetical protein